MSQTAQFTDTPVSSETGWDVLNRKWRSIRFFFARRAFESKLERILRAAAGHEGNSLPAGDYEYELLHTEADSLCTEFADRWDSTLTFSRRRFLAWPNWKDCPFRRRRRTMPGSHALAWSPYHWPYSSWEP